MIFSQKHKFIFIKGRKVAGTSLEIALSPHCGPHDILTPISPADELKRLALGGRPQNYAGQEIEAQYLALVQAGDFEAAIKTRVHSATAYPFFNHMSLAAVEKLLDPPAQDYTLVYATRNPYQKVASLANMYVSFQNYAGKPMENTQEDIRKSIIRFFETGQYILAHNRALYQSQRRYKARFIVRQEHLAADYKSLCAHFDLPADTSEMPHAKQGAGGEGYALEALFTRAQLDIINTDFADEFRDNGYETI